MKHTFLTEQEINTMLQKTRNLAERLEEKGMKEQAIQVLRIGSVFADCSLKIAGITRRPFQCEHGHVLKGKDVQKFYTEAGICLHCDHLLGETLEQRNEERGEA